MTEKPKTENDKPANDNRGDPPDAAELAGVKRKDGETDKDEAPSGAVSPDDLSSENDDGAG
ncbi:hypothetical protein [Methylopila sp. M107]|uniref:hypothetical protein n=1 Tax=Methylopila sp. M107 TaxID=1101190 RepID=UPI0003742AD8|nr:hypothetical protein [Methylopila sp. M107]